MQASGVITFTTDFGHKGPFTGVMKGVVLSRFAGASIVDLAHDIPAHWPPEAGFWMNRAFRYFPPGTVHVGIVDPGVGTERHILAATADQHVFLAPDNGLLDPIIGGVDGAEVRRLETETLSSLGLATPSLTFHGRDIFAPVAAEIAAGRLTPADLGPVVSEWIPGWLDEPEVSADSVSGVIVTIDAFGNLISNIDQSLLESIPDPVVSFTGRHFDISPTYGRVKPGDYLALVNSFGVLEIARAESSAAEGLGSGRGAPVVVRSGNRRI